MLQIGFCTPCLRPTNPGSPGKELRVIREFSRALLDNTGGRKQAWHDDCIILVDMGRDGGGLIIRHHFFFNIDLLFRLKINT